MPCFAPQVFPRLSKLQPPILFGQQERFVGKNENEKMAKIFEGRIRIICEPDTRIDKRWDHCVRVGPMPSERLQ